MTNGSGARCAAVSGTVVWLAITALSGCGAEDAAGAEAQGGVQVDAGGGQSAGGEATGGAAAGGQAAGGTGGEATGGAAAGGAGGDLAPGGIGETGGSGGSGGAGGEPPLEADGPYHVGYRQSEVVYTPAPSDGAEPRTLRLALWYPTDATEGTATSYLLGRIQRPEVFADAPLAAGDRFPVVVFSHGSGGLAEQSVFLTEFFASHGFVVAAPDHTGNTFRDGGDIPPEMFSLRPQDISAVLDHLYDGLPGDDPLRGHLDEQVVMAGHSFGAYTTLANAGTAYDTDYIAATCAGPGAGEYFCQAWNDHPALHELFAAGFRDPRIDLAIPMAPLGGPVFDFGAAEIPVLLVTAGRDETLPEATNGDDVWAGLDGPDDLRLVFPDAGHFSFANICKELPGVVQGDGCLPDNTDPDEVHRVVRAVSWAFVRHHLFGDASHDDVLSGATPVSDAATVTPKR